MALLSTLKGNKRAGIQGIGQARGSLSFVVVVVVLWVG